VLTILDRYGGNMWKRNKNNGPNVDISAFELVFERLTLQNQITEEDLNEFISLLPTQDEFENEASELIFQKSLHTRSDILFHSTLKYLVQKDLDFEVDIVSILNIEAPLFQNTLSPQEFKILEELAQSESTFETSEENEDADAFEKLEKFKEMERDFDLLFQNREDQLQSFVHSLPLPFIPASANTPEESISIHLDAFGLLDKKGKALLDLSQKRSMLWSSVYRFLFLLGGLGFTFYQNWFAAIWNNYKVNPESFSYLSVDAGAFMFQILIACLFFYSLLKEIKQHSFTMENTRKKTSLALKTLFTRCDVKQSNFKEFLTQKYSNLTGDELEAITLRVFK
jgi:hypothetical protein